MLCRPSDDHENTHRGPTNTRHFAFIPMASSLSRRTVTSSFQLYTLGTAVLTVIFESTDYHMLKAQNMATCRRTAVANPFAQRLVILRERLPPAPVDPIPVDRNTDLEHLVRHDVCSWLVPFRSKCV